MEKTFATPRRPLPPPRKKYRAVQGVPHLRATVDRQDWRPSLPSLVTDIDTSTASLDGHTEPW